MPILLIPSGLPAVPAAARFPVVALEMQFTSAAWTDITRYSRIGQGGQITAIRGSSRVESPVIRYDPGTLACGLDNRDRRFDPTNLAGPYVAGGKTQVMPTVPVRLSATYASITYRLFTGTVDTWTLTYTPPNDSVTAVSATDGFKLLGVQPRAGRAVYKGPGEDSGARVNRILDDAGWPGSQRSVAAGNATLQATILGFTSSVITTNLNPPPGTKQVGSGTNIPDYVIAGPAPGVFTAAVPTTVLNAASSATPLDELYLVADTEMGEMYIDGNGFLVFRNRAAVFTDTRSNTSQATFGDGPGELPYASVTVAYDESTMWNAATISNLGGTLQTAIDPIGSQVPPAGFGLHIFDSENLIADTDWQALGYASWIVNTSKTLELRFSDITIHPQRDPANLFPQILGRLIGDRITIKRRPPGGGAVISRDVFIRGITHTITSKTWETTWVLEDATSLFQPFIIGDAVNGVIGTSLIGF